MKKHVFAALGLALSMAGASAQVLISEGFDNVSTLSGWTISNNSSPGGSISAGWFQGDGSQFAAQSGAGSSFIASSRDTAGAGGGLYNLLVTPTFATDQPVDIVFYVRGASASGRFDQLAFGWGSGAGIPGDASMSLPTVVGTGGWAQYIVHIDAQGAGTVGRFAIAYAGVTNNANYLGIDSLSITAVPEPGAAWLLGAGLAGLAGWTRRRLAR